MKDEDVGKIWETCFDAERDDMVDRPFTIKRLIFKLVNERTMYHLRGVDNITTQSKKTAQLRTLAEFGIDPSTWGGK